MFPSLMLPFLLPLLILLPANLGIPLPHIYLSPSGQPGQPSFSRKLSLEHVRLVSTDASMSTFVLPTRSLRKPPLDPLLVPAASPAPQGPVAGPIGSPLPRHRHRPHRPGRSRAISPSPSKTPGCGQICAEPFTSTPFGSPCGCVLPMKIKLLLDVSLYAVFPLVNQLEIQIAEGIYLDQSQVVIVGASADSQNQGRTLVDVNLVPLEERFDNTTALLIYERFWQKKVPLNRTLFGAYKVVYITYPGIPSSPPSGDSSGNGPTGSVGNQQFPITAYMDDKNQKMSPRIIFVIALSVLVLLVVCCGAAAILLKCRKAGRPSNAVGPVITPSINKRSGMGSMLSSSPASSTSASLLSAMPASILSVKTFSLAELERATEKFSSKRILGEGGFGRVYHGLMEDGADVAVKLLTRDIHNGEREFISEVEMLSRLHHRNLVKLIGICIDERIRCLVYELVPNGSVESHLHGVDKERGPLDWDARLKIALGAARGLAYLHEDSNPRVIHRDFKASNVLLEDDFTPKVSDFGLAREATEGSHPISTRVMGTFGYVAPEYAMTGHLLVKSDVYSYGVVLLELLSARTKKMSTVAIEPFLHYPLRRARSPNIRTNSKRATPFYLYHNRRPLSGGSRLSSWGIRPPRALTLRASTSTDASVVETTESSTVVFKETFPVKWKVKVRTLKKVEGKITIRLIKRKDEENWQLVVGCSLPGKWVLHWGVTYIGDMGSEWDQPPPEMRPPGSIPIKDYAIESPLEKSTVLEGESFYEVKIDFNTTNSIAAINFVLKDEDSGSWYQHRGRDFKVPLVQYLQDDGNVVGAKKGFGIWPGALGQLSNMLLKSDGAETKEEYSNSESKSPSQQKSHLEGFYEEHSVVKETLADNSVTVLVRQSPDTAKNLLYIETNLPGDVIVHWGVCKDEGKKWELPEQPYPSETIVFKNKALRTLLQQQEGGKISSGSFTLDVGLTGFVFVLKLNESTWVNCMGKDFYIPLSSSKFLNDQYSQSQSGNVSETNESDTAYTDGIINEIRNLVSGISSGKSLKTKTVEAQESILQEIEKLAAEAYSIFRSSIPMFTEDAVSEAEAVKPPVKITFGTGSGFEVVCQGFNWESHKSGRWYMELHEKAAALSSLGFTVVWLPPPTESVSPEGYMPTDLYNLNCRYGSVDELKSLVKRFHEVGIKILGDAVLNHRCAQYKNQNGVWNIFGGRLNWDDRAVVADDPHFQGRGNKSSGDNFHAAPNIDHSQEFVRKDLKEWLCWLREEIGYDGWRLDFVRGFWGGYVKDYLDASEPYFAVGEYWDSLSYTYGEMDHNQDAHRQRIVDWINATNGSAGAFDVTTKGILHAALERCEYWRLSDQKGKPPGVVGWWPSRAVTFIENHDTGSTQGHWRFPGGKEMQGYAYILTHPGTPSVFYDHIFSDYQAEISKLISLRTRNKIQCRSTVKITKAERDVYAAIIDDKVAMKIGPGSYEPQTGQKWSLASEGKDYKVWEAS